MTRCGKPRAFVAFLFLVLIGGGAPTRADETPVADLGDRLELFVDAQRIDSMIGVQLVLHPPARGEVALRFDDAWDGLYSGYVTVFQDGDRYRMYYRGFPEAKGEQVTCYAESPDGIRWTKPNLGLYSFGDSTRNNIVWKSPPSKGTHNFAPFKDNRPGVPDDQRYKALAGTPPHAYASADGLHWQSLAEKPVLTKGTFDSQNLAFWDPNRSQYAAYFRVAINKVRSIATARSDDFLNWSDPTPIDLGPTTPEQFYTNATTPYFRAPHYYFSFPKRFVPDRKKLAEHTEKGISDGVFLSSRDGLHFDRTFGEAFIRPGRDPLNWGDRSNMVAWGIVQTGPDEMSIYYSQDYRYPSAHMRRGILRLDGIASAAAGNAAGELVTKPFRFAGKTLVLNYATSAAGSIRVEVQDPEGKPFDGFAMADARDLYGDNIAEAFSWSSGSDISALAGKPLRLRFVMKDADVYSYRFGE